MAVAVAAVAVARAVGAVDTSSFRWDEWIKVLSDTIPGLERSVLLSVVAEYLIADAMLYATITDADLSGVETQPFSHLTVCDDRSVVRPNFHPLTSSDRTLSSADPPFAIRPSSIPGAGFGLFTFRPLTRHAVFIPYRGRLLMDKPERSDAGRYNTAVHCDHDYCFGVTRTICVCGADRDPAITSCARYANDSYRNPLELQNNLRWFVYKPLRRGTTTSPSTTACERETDPRCWRVGFVPTTDIAAGSELFVSYGSKYWGERVPGFCVSLLFGAVTSNNQSFELLSRALTTFSGEEMPGRFEYELDEFAFEHLLFSIRA